MTTKRPKLRLRKQVLICLPIIILLITLVTGLAINKNKYFSKEINKNNQMANANIEDGPNLSDLEYIKEFTKMIENRQKDNTVIYYAENFKLDIDKTLEIAHRLTDNYENKEYQKTNVIANKTLAKKIGSFKSFEAGVVYFVRDLYRYPERYGSSINEIRLDETPTTKRNIKNGVIYMDNGLTFEQYLGKICDLFEIDKSIALAIVHEETGVMTSALFNKSNNIGGQRGYDGWMRFTTLEAGVISHVVSLKALTDKYNIDMKSPNAVAKLSGIYVKGNINSYSDSWTGKVLFFKNKIDQKDLFTIKK